MTASLREGYVGVVIGASGAIGQAWMKLLEEDARCANAIGLSRHSVPMFQLEDETSMHQCAQAISKQGPIHLVLDATGALAIDGRGPEKRLEDLDGHALMRSFQVNALGPALLLKHFVPLLAMGEKVIWAKLSARVGSIEDNRKGGWYGYRASKAALNMFLQTAAIEISRRRPMAVIAALQPGTVRSKLSQPFAGDDALDPRLSAQRLLSVLDKLEPSGRAIFVDHQGATIPW